MRLMRISVKKPTMSEKSPKSEVKPEQGPLGMNQSLKEHCFGTASGNGTGSSEDSVNISHVVPDSSD